MKGPCACGSEMPEVSLYNVRQHICANCGREYELVGTSVETTVPPWCERVERLERQVSAMLGTSNSFAWQPPKAKVRVSKP